MTSSQGMSTALERIEKEREEKTGFLDLGGLGLTDLPEELATLTHLVQLNLGKFVLDPDAHWRMHLNEPENRLGEASWDVLEPLENLRSLVTNWCGLTNLGFVEKVKRLRHLDISGNPLPNLELLTRLTSLQKIDCSSTQVSDLSPLSSLASLQSIGCSHTQVRDLSPLSSLASLQTIDCSYTQVSNLGPLLSISRLNQLIIWSVPITEIPEALVFKLSLKELLVTDVPDTGLPAEVLSEIRGQGVPGTAHPESV